MVEEGMTDGFEIQSGLAEVNGAQLYYEVTGAGVPILLLHAGVADCRMWDGQMADFAARYKVVRFDLRGFGRSSMPAMAFSNVADVKGIMDYLGIKPAFVVGISFGGMIALDFTLAHPDYVRGLILGAPSVSGATPSSRIRAFWRDEEEALSAGDLQAATELNLELWVDGPHRTAEEVNPEVREGVRQMQMAIFSKDIPEGVDEIEPKWPAIKRLGEVSAPSQILIGELDLEEKHALVDRLVEEVPGSQKSMIPGVAHMLNMEAPDAFNKIVLQFLASV
jgi:pimeloyl-ACP methyl ester carboxylesterase